MQSITKIYLHADGVEGVLLTSPPKKDNIGKDAEKDN